MRVDILSREYPPEVYGGAGVHVAELVNALRPTTDVVVRAFGMPRDGREVFSYLVPAQLTSANPALATLGVDLQMAEDVAGADLVHSHTWYANGAGHLAKMTHGIPHVVTAHSLEPLRPWKAEQLGGGYRVSSWIEREAYEAADAIVAVSGGMRRDVLAAYPAVPPERVHVIHNGIDTTLYRPDPGTEVLAKHGINPDRPCVLFVGRITRQKGVPHLVRAGASLGPGTQLVLCAGGADTPELDAEFRGLVALSEKTRTGVRWIPEMLPRDEVVQLLTHATVFACPSVYEPLGIVNLEAMACGTPVVASDVGGM